MQCSDASIVGLLAAWIYMGFESLASAVGLGDFCFLSYMYFLGAF